MATAGTGGLLCGGAWIAATVIGEVLCPQPWCTKGSSPVYRWNTPNPPDSDDDSGCGQPQADPNDPDGDYDGDGTTSREELKKADQKLWDEEITDKRPRG